MSLNKGDTLLKGQELISENGKFTAKINQNNYFAVYYNSYFLWGFDSVIDRIEMQTDGILAIHDAQNHTFISQNDPGEGDYLVLEDVGLIVIYNDKNMPIWYTGSILRKLNVQISIYFLKAK